MSDDGRLLENRYRLLRRIATNQASTTWEAVDTRTDTRCVVKELSVAGVVRGGSTADTWDGDFTKMIDLFEREARVLANLDHPGIPRFIDHFRIEVDGDQWLYTVQEFVEGETIESLVRGGRHFTEDEAISVCRDVTTLLGYLHDRSPPLIHRDVKPSNIILGADDVVHLVDFGSVRDLVDGDGLAGKTIVGTYGYMPIEQYEARAVPQSDFYALGMTLVFLLSHKDPTQIPRTGMTLAFRAHVNVSERFARVIEWMIAPAPENRPPDADAILASLTENLLRLPDLREPRVSSSVPSSPDTVLARRRVISLAAGLLALAVGLLGFLTSGLRFLDEPAERTSPVDFEPAEITSTAPGDAPVRSQSPTRVPPTPVAVVGGVLTLDLDRDFVYVKSGWPMGRSVAQTSLPMPQRRPPDDLILPPEEYLQNVVYGTVPLGNLGSSVDYALLNDEGARSMFIDRNDNGDLTDDGPPQGNEGSGGVFATAVSVNAAVRLDDGSERIRPYQMWIWFTGSGDAPPTARMYARHHYRGEVTLGDETYGASVFEYRDHDALYRESGVCIDLSRNGECEEPEELFHDGDVIATPSGDIRIRLAYP
jgi:serine/threonine protein kinase